MMTSRRFSIRAGHVLFINGGWWASQVVAQARAGGVGGHPFTQSVAFKDVDNE